MLLNEQTHINIHTYISIQYIFAFRDLRDVTEIWFVCICLPLSVSMSGWYLAKRSVKVSFWWLCLRLCIVIRYQSTIYCITVRCVLKYYLVGTSCIVPISEWISVPFILRTRFACHIYRTWSQLSGSDHRYLWLIVFWHCHRPSAKSRHLVLLIKGNHLLCIWDTLQPGSIH